MKKEESVLVMEEATKEVIKKAPKSSNVRTSKKVTEEKKQELIDAKKEERQKDESQKGIAEKMQEVNDAKKEEPQKDESQKGIAEKMQDVVVKVQKKVSDVEKNQYATLISKIEEEYQKVELSYLNVAFTLYEIYKKKLYQIDNFQNIYDFAKDRFSIARGTASNFINIVQKFAKFDDSGKPIGLQDYVKDFRSSQLMILLPMPDDFIKTISPETSVRAIKDLKNKYIESLNVLECKDANKDESKDEIETDNETLTSSINKPLEKKDLNENNGCHVCLVNSIIELIALSDVVESTLSDVKKLNKNKKVFISVNIVAE